MAIPLTLANALGDEINAFMLNPKDIRSKGDSISRIENEAKKLAKVQVADGYVVLAAVSALRMDYGTMRSRFKIAKNNNVRSVQVMNYAMALNFCGFFSEAGDIVKAHWQSCEDLQLAADRAMSAMHFQLFAEIQQRIVAAKIETTEMHEAAASNIVEFAAAMSEAGLSDSDIAVLADMAGEVMRAHQVQKSVITETYCYPGDDGSKSLCRTIYVPVSFDEASDMTMELAERYAVANLPHSVGKFMIRFSGENEHNS